MAATDARVLPRKGVAYRVTFSIVDAEGDPVTGATSVDSEVSKDGGTFTDCTNEATEIGATGIYTLDVTAAEMNADTVSVIVKTPSAKTTPLIFYPEEEGDIRVEMTGLADALLKRDLSAVSGEAARSTANAMRRLRNKWGVAGATLTVMEEDDTTPAWTAVVNGEP